jgi:hypothetical protein
VRHTFAGLALRADRVARLQPLRVLALVVGGTFLVLTAFNLIVLVPDLASHPDSIGVDFRVVAGSTRRWLAGDGYYLDWQLTGPYTWRGGESLYPPPMAVLMMPFLVLPEVVWWAVPIGLVGYAVWRFRPAPWALALIAACLWYPRTYELVLYGNPSMWVAGLVAAALIWSWPAVLVLVKPTLAPLALVGANRRSWWLALAALAVLSLVLLPMWPDWFRAVFDGSAAWGTSWEYSVRDLPLILIPMLAWLGRSTTAADVG